MSDGYSKYFEEVQEYQDLCKELRIEPKALDIDYDHFRELKNLPCVHWERGKYRVDFENYPEYGI